MLSGSEVVEAKRRRVRVWVWVDIDVDALLRVFATAHRICVRREDESMVLREQGVECRGGGGCD